MPSSSLALAKRLVLMAAVCGAAAVAQAAPVSLQLTGFSFAPGAGYGVDANESAATLLDAVFGNSGFAAQTVVLSPGDSFTVTLGSAQLREPNAQGGIVLAETDAIGLDATLSFGGALGAQAFTANVTADLGSVSDAAADLTITWSPLALDLGNGDFLD